MSFRGDTASVLSSSSASAVGGSTNSCCAFASVAASCSGSSASCMLKRLLRRAALTDILGAVGVDADPTRKRPCEWPGVDGESAARGRVENGCEWPGVSSGFGPAARSAVLVLGVDAEGTRAAEVVGMTTWRPWEWLEDSVVMEGMVVKRRREDVWWKCVGVVVSGLL